MRLGTEHPASVHNTSCCRSWYSGCSRRRGWEPGYRSLLDTPEVPSWRPRGSTLRSQTGSERKVEAGPAVHGRFGPDLPAVAMDDALNCREPDSGPGELRFRMQAAERAEQVGCVAWVKAGAVVAQEEGPASRAVHA